MALNPYGFEASNENWCLYFLSQNARILGNTLESLDYVKLNKTLNMAPERFDFARIFRGETILIFIATIG